MLLLLPHPRCLPATKTTAGRRTPFSQSRFSARTKYFEVLRSTSEYFEVPGMCLCAVISSFFVLLLAAFLRRRAALLLPHADADAATACSLLSGSGRKRSQHSRLPANLLRFVAPQPKVRRGALMYNLGTNCQPQLMCRRFSLPEQSGAT